MKYSDRHSFYSAFFFSSLTPQTLSSSPFFPFVSPFSLPFSPFSQGEGLSLFSSFLFLTSSACCKNSEVIFKCDLLYSAESLSIGCVIPRPDSHWLRGRDHATQSAILHPLAEYCNIAVDIIASRSANLSIVPAPSSSSGPRSRRAAWP